MILVVLHVHVIIVVVVHLAVEVVIVLNHQCEIIDVNDVHLHIEIDEDQLILKKNIHRNIEGKFLIKKALKISRKYSYIIINRSPPRPSRDNERRRSPRPPPTIQQSTQRTIVYLQESSHSR